ncbi:hypothetical protein BDW02DRAFT_512798, partial [Decorospora gaudefroyi]
MAEFNRAREDQDWDAVRSVLRTRFRTQDQVQQEETEDSLRRWCQACSVTDNLSLRGYLDSFGPRFTRCLEAGTVTNGQKGFYLAKGLNKSLLTKTLNKFDLSTTRPYEFDYAKLEAFL